MLMEMKKYAVMMHMPEGKLPGFYAQIVKALANKAVLFDRDKELLIVSTEEERGPLEEIMSKYHVDFEKLALLLLPESAELSKRADDYGFTSRAGYTYMYDNLVSVYRCFIMDDDPAAEQTQALLQMEKYLLARFTLNHDEYYVAEKQLEELLSGIAKAYRCQVEFVS